MSAIDASGSTLPLLVAPAVADTKMGRRPSVDISLDRGDERVGAHGVVVVDGNHA